MRESPLSRRYLIAGLVAAAIGLAASAPPGVDPATAEMAALLTSLADKVDPLKLPILLNDRAAEILAEQLTWPRPTMDRIRLRASYSLNLLNAGRIQDSLEALEALEEDAKKNAPEAWTRRHNLAVMQRAISYMRLAEEQNCHLGNTRESCLMPIRGGRPQQREARPARSRCCSRSWGGARSLEARWLLNVAHMTLGSYPDGVPKPFLIPPSALASEYPLPTFPNVAKEAGVDVYGLAGGAALDDFDGDGDLDLLISFMGLYDQARFAGTAATAASRSAPSSRGSWGRGAASTWSTRTTTTTASWTLDPARRLAEEPGPLPDLAAAQPGRGRSSTRPARAGSWPTSPRPRRPPGSTTTATGTWTCS
jgi:hypothetical protein